VIAGDTPLAELLAQGGTRFAAAEGAPAFKLWLRHGKRVAGRIRVDAGARRAVVESGASLLAVGITSVEGDFRAGDGVELVGPDGEAFARGVVSVDAADLEPGVEAVHRDRLVLL
jgi:glutamate 5-kinase